MQEGAFVLIDCLGFKGIWKRTDPALLLQKFSQLGSSIQATLDVLEKIFQFDEDASLRIHHRLLSDTVAISLLRNCGPARRESRSASSPSTASRPT